MKPAKILYFIEGVAPRPEDFEAASQMAATVVFRNARAVPPEQHSLEICDGVAGKVPEIYAAAYPNANEAIKKKADELKALSGKVGDSPAPKAAKAPAAAKAAPAPAWNPNPAS